MTARHVYDQNFYDHMERGARLSARNTVAFLKRHLPIDSVLDVGAGRGAWLAEWLASGTAEAVGVDGAYVERDRLLIPQSAFIPYDLQTPLNLNRSFDLVESLEVAEHINRRAADVFVNSLVAHGRAVLFSAATPGQGGEHHVNEQPLDYWREKFARHGFDAYDPLRPHLRDNLDVEPWYRYNMLLYVHRSLRDSLPAAILETAVPAGERVRDFRPLGYRSRAFVRSCLPVAVNTRWAVFKDRVRPYLRRTKRLGA